METPDKYSFNNSKKSCSCNKGFEIKPDNNIATQALTGQTILRTYNAHSNNLSEELKETSNSNAKPILLAFLPCGLRNAFKEALIRVFPDLFENEKIIIEGNLNFEKKIHHYIDSLFLANELPDIFITADFNSLYHSYFLNNFLNENYFDKSLTTVHPFYKKAECFDHNGIMTILSANLLVMVVDKHRYEGKYLPTNLENLLDSSLNKSIVLRGDDDFFCNAVFFPIYKKYGEQGLSQLAKNTKNGMHPSEMVKAINSGNNSSAAVYVMPYSFALKIRNNERFQVIWPEEGAIVSPVQMLVKKGSYAKYNKLIDYLLGNEMGNVLEQVGFPSVNIDTEKNYPGKNLNWIGWDYIMKNDIKETKETMQNIFYKAYK